MRYRAAHKQGNGYLCSKSQLDFIDPLLPGRITGHADRTGLTAPGMPDRAVYRLVLPGGSEVPGLFVYEDDEFVPRNEWYAKQREWEKVEV